MFYALAGIILVSRLGALSQKVYVAIGLVGVPIFTEKGGIDYIFKPTSCTKKKWIHRLKNNKTGGQYERIY